MSLKLLSWAFEQDLPCAEKIVLLALADMADMDGKCWPSQAHLAKRCGIARETVNRQVRMLVNAGLVRLEQRANEHGQQANLYFVRCDAGSHPPVIVDHTPCDGRSQPPVTDDHTEPSIRTFKKDISSLRADFAAWYAAYPLHVGKGEAEKAYAKARKAASASDLLEGIGRYRSGKPDYAEWSHPATWLNKQRWLDEYSRPGGNGAAAMDYSEPWPQRLADLARGGRWMADLWGPAPGKAGCRVPPELLPQETGYSG